jgi:hypothetical protein
MPALLKNTDCPGCHHRHHFSLPTGELTAGRNYDYVCPETGKKVSLRPTWTGEMVRSAPQGAVALTPGAADQAQQESHPQPQVAATDEPEGSSTRLQKVLPKVKDLAGQVGGMARLSDIVQDLKETKE